MLLYHKAQVLVLFFSSYVNDLSQAVQGSRVSTHADDMNICHQPYDIAQLSEAINIDLAKVEDWLNGNELFPNVV